MSAGTLLQPKSEPFTVGDIKQIIDLANCDIQLAKDLAKAFTINAKPTCVTLLSKDLNIDELAAICILCKFLIQGIRAHGIFKDAPGDYRTQLGELINLYDGLKYTVFEGTNATFTKSCIEHNDTSYDIPRNFLSKKVLRNPNDLNRTITAPMRADIVKLIEGMKSIFGSSTNMPSITFSTKPGFFESIPNMKEYNFTAGTFTKAKTALSKLITERCANDENVKNWYIQWSLIFQQLFGEMPFFVTDMSYKEIKKDPFVNISSKTPAYQENTIVGQITQAGGKSRRTRTKRATHGSTKRKQHKKHKATQRKQRK